MSGFVGTGRETPQHYSDGLEPEDRDGEAGGDWWVARCVCGWSQGVYPTAEDACDALMDHAFDAGRKFGLAVGA